MDTHSLQIPPRFWNGRSVLVTGAGGFVGAWLTSALLEQGANVVALVRDLRKEAMLTLLGLEERVSIVAGDVIQRSTLERLLAGYEVQVVFHLAAEALVGAAQRSPMSTFESNVRGTWTLLEACRTVGVESVVVASSDKAYGHHEVLPYEESFALRPKYPYEASKACADIVSRCYAVTYGLPVSVARCANIYGGGDMNWSRIIPGSIRSVLAGESPVIRSDGSMVRDYLYVDDAVDGYLRLAVAQMGSTVARGEPFNFGSDDPVSVLELTERILRHAGRPDLRPKIQGRPLNEIERQNVSSVKASRLLGWCPTVGLDEGLRRALRWYRAHFDHRRSANKAHHQNGVLEQVVS